MVDSDGRIVLVNREIERLFGYTRDELLGNSVDILLPDRSRPGHAAFRAGFMSEPRARLMGAGKELYGLHKDGTEMPLEIGLSPIETDEGMFVLSSVVDISARNAAEKERQLLEGQLRQAQKMEAVGTLAGGIAHDFNNILGGIIGYAELLEPALATDRARVDLADLLTQAERGRHLVERLLAFSRRQEAERRPLSMSSALEDTRRILRATLPANIDIRVALHEPLPRVLADRTAVQQILMNLGTNAAHAMPGGGVLDIRAESFYVRDSKARAHPELHEGPHILVAVSDTGTGMSAEVKARALEPFFTTKPRGSGSGLGLSMVHGIMKEHEGGLEMDSEPGAGTTVRCFFPALSDTNGELSSDQGPAPGASGQRVLFIDDEPSLALVGRRRLEHLGYRVTALTDGAEALALFRRDPTAFDVVMTDYSMPGRNGIELVRAMRESHPDLRAVLLTGYVDAVSAQEARFAGIEHIVQKPLTLAQLGAAVAAVLEAG
jgi:hypothetical protein